VLLSQKKKLNEGSIIKSTNVNQNTTKLTESHRARTRPTAANDKNILLITFPHMHTPSERVAEGESRHHARHVAQVTEN
jgi:hypothetical protein